MELKKGAFLDTETTGLDPENHEILEVGVLLFSYTPFGAVTSKIGSWHGLQEPTKPVDPKALEVNQITLEQLKGKSLDLAALREALEGVEIIVAHSAEFDRSFLDALFRNAGQQPIAGATWLCSRTGIPWKRLGFRSTALGSLARDFGIRNPAPHRALGDCATGLALISRRAPGGGSYLRRLLIDAGMNPWPVQSGWQKFLEWIRGASGFAWGRP